MKNIFTNKKIYQMLGSEGPAKTDSNKKYGKDASMQEALQNPKVYKKGKRKGLRKAKRLAKK